MKLEVEARIGHANGFRLEAAFACEAEALAVVGPSGSGKTSLLEALSGLLPGARVRLDGRDLAELPLHRRGMAYVTQDALLFPHLTVRGNLLYSPAAAGRASEAERVAAELGIAPLLDRMPRHLSGGERRRAALARAILSRPALLLLDEPFGGLDEQRRREAMSLLARVVRSHRLPMVLVSHRADEAIGLTGWALRLEDGRVAASGPSFSVLRAGETQVDNYFTGTVCGPDRVRVGGLELHAPVPEGASGELRLACYAHDLLLATEMPRSVSARNCFWASVASVAEGAGAALVTLQAPPLSALVTPDALRALGLRPGSRVAVLIKATAIACLGTA